MFEKEKFNEEDVSCNDNCSCHNHDHECSEDGCECGCNDENNFIDIIDEDGNTISCEVVDNFEFKGKEYLLVEHPEEEELYMFRIEEQEEEISLVVPDEAEFEEVSAYYDSMIEEQEEE